MKECLVAEKISQMLPCVTLLVLPTAREAFLTHFKAPMNKIFCATIIAASLAASAAQAAQPFYLGATLGLTKGNSTISDGFVTLESPDNPRPLGINAGYRINRNFAIEAGYTHFGQFDFSNGGQLDINTTHLALKGTAQLSDNWSLVGKVGAARHEVDMSGSIGNTGDTSKTLRMLTVGAEYRFSEQWSGSLALSDYGTKREPGFNLRTRAFEIGLQYNF